MAVNETEALEKRCGGLVGGKSGDRTKVER